MLVSPAACLGHNAVTALLSKGSMGEDLGFTLGAESPR